MAVIMSYHKLIERESKNVDWFWKFGTIFFLLAAVTCCMVTSYSFHKLTYAYDDHCILDADVKFISDSPEESNTSVISSAFASSSSENSPWIINDNVDDSPIDVLLRKYPEIQEEQKNFLETHVIDEKFSNWGPRINCDWALHLPIFQCCFAIIIVTFFCICGKGGKAEKNSFLAQPWRIVMPGLIFFLVMTVISISYISFVNSGMKKFCQSLTVEFPTIECHHAMNFFKIKKGDLEPDILYKIIFTVNWFVFAFWLFLVIVMLLRIIFVIDFQLVRVTIKTCEYENTNERSSFKVVESSKSDLNYNFLMEIKYEEFIQENHDDENGTGESMSSLKDNEVKKEESKK